MSTHIQGNPETMLEDKKATQLWSLGDSEDMCSVFGPSTVLFPQLSISEFYPLAPFCL